MIALSHISIIFLIFTSGLGISLNRIKEDLAELNYIANHLFRGSVLINLCNLAEFLDKKENGFTNASFKMAKFSNFSNHTDSFWQKFEGLSIKELASGCLQKNLKKCCFSKIRPKHLRTFGQLNRAKFKMKIQKVNILKKGNFEDVLEKERSLQDSDTDTDTDTEEESGEIFLK